MQVWFKFQIDIFNGAAKANNIILYLFRILVDCS